MRVCQGNFETRKYLSKRKARTPSPRKSIKLVGNVGKKSHLACSLDRNSKVTLMKRTVAGYTSGENLCSLGDELSKLCYVLVIDAGHLILAEDANLLSSVCLAKCGTLIFVSFHRLKS